MENKNLVWKVHTPNLLSEILENDQLSILERPIQKFASILEEVSIRCSQLNDPELNKLMCRLTLYSIADPESDCYDKEMIEEILSIEPN